MSALPEFSRRPTRPYSKEVGASPGKLRIAWTTTPASGDKIDPECVKAVNETVRAWRLGHTLIEGGPRYDWDEFLANVHIIWTAFTALSADGVAAALKQKPSADNLEAVTLACYEDGKSRSALELLNSLSYNNTLSRSVGAFFQDVDALVTPTIARVPAKLGELIKIAKA